MIEGKIVIVTGGASGIGAAIVRRVVENGGLAVIADRDLEGGERLAQSLGRSTKFHRLDVTSEASWEELLRDGHQARACAHKP